MERLHKLVWEFPFANPDLDFAVWLAALLTAIQRPLIAGPVPGIAFIGNTAGIGKGLLIDAIGTLVWGHGIPTRSYPSDPIEAAKVKLSLALSAVPAVHFDNLPEGGFYGSSELDSAITSTDVSGRILGQSRETGPVPLRPVWMLSGNNISPSRDAFRRWLPCNLKTDLESPHERVGLEIPDFRRHVSLHRAELLHHALVILATHAIAGRPGNNWAPLGSFEEWDKMIRGAVWFATDSDCVETQRKAHAESPERQDKLALLEGWRELPDGTSEGLSVQQAMVTVQDNPALYPTLHSAFSRFGKGGKPPSHQAIQYKLRGMHDQNIGGMKFEKCGSTRTGTGLWRVVNV